jgi:transposase-like protein
MDIIVLISIVLSIIKKCELKVLAVLEYMFHGSCRKVSKVLSLAIEPISKSTVHDLARKVSTIKVSSEPKFRRCIAIDETKICIKKAWVYIWSAIDVNSKELLALEVSYGRNCLNALISRK